METPEIPDAARRAARAALDREAAREAQTTHADTLTAALRELLDSGLQPREVAVFVTAAGFRITAASVWYSANGRERKKGRKGRGHDVDSISNPG